MRSATSRDPGRRVSTIAATVAVILCILLRSVVWVVWEQSNFESDQAIVGLMAKHIAELRALPLLFYGQHHQLAVEAWLVAPVFRIFGATVAGLKLPLVAMNVAIALLLVKILTDDVELGTGAAFLSSLFFLIPPPITSSRLVEASGGNIEPLLYTVVLWIVRRRPVVFGLVAGIGFLNREFTAYAVAAILLLELWYGELFSIANLRAKTIVCAEILGVVLVTRLLKAHADLLGPGTGGTLPAEVVNGQIEFWTSRFCWNPSAIVPNLQWVFRDNLGVIFGWHTGPLSAYVTSALEGGHTVALVAFAVLFGAAAAGRIGARAVQEAQTGVQGALRRQIAAPGSAFPVYLVLVGLQAVGVYALASCLVQDGTLIRYTLLALFVPVGVLAWLLRSGSGTTAKASGVVAALVWTAASVADHGRLIAEYVHHAPRNDYRELADFLEREGIRYGRAPYWTAYHIAFLTEERVTLGSYEKVRVNEYEDIVTRHEAESVSVFFDVPCQGAGRVPFRRWCLEDVDRARHPVAQRAR